MIGDFKGPYSYDKRTVEDWNSTVIGVYYIGIKTPEGKLTVYYIGKAAGESGIRGRLLDHLRDDEWDDVTHFGYHIVDSPEEAESFESEEREKYKPKYNKN